MTEPRNYFEAYPDYLARKKLLEDSMVKSSLKFAKRLKKARIKDRARESYWEMKTVEKAMIKAGTHLLLVDSVHKAIQVLKLLKK